MSYHHAFVCTLTEWLQPQIWHAARIGKPQPAWKQFFVDHGCPDTTLATFAKAQDSDFSMATSSRADQ